MKHLHDPFNHDNAFFDDAQIVHHQTLDSTVVFVACKQAFKDGLFAGHSSRASLRSKTCSMM
jgi:hypothetical protein